MIYPSFVSIPDWSDWQLREVTFADVTNWFQFQIGPIGRRLLSGYLGQLIHVSIPDWSDWQSPSTLISSFMMKVSIPDWSDWQYQPPEK